MINWGFFKRHFWGELLRYQQGRLSPSLGRVPVAVEDAVKVEPVGEFELKGMAAYNVVHAVS